MDTPGWRIHGTIRSCFEFLPKVFLGLMYPFSCVLLRQIARYLPHHRSGNASKTHPKSSHDKFKTASYSLKNTLKFLTRKTTSKKDRLQIGQTHSGLHRFQSDLYLVLSASYASPLKSLKGGTKVLALRCCSGI